MSHLRRFGRLVWQLLRELSDQNAYERHLRHHGRTHSPQEWRLFCEEHFRAKYQRAKCC